MEKEPLVSVVMSVYNDTTYLKEAIESITHQTYDNWELIIVDDGSDNDLFLWIQKNIPQDKRIKVITLDYNHGLHVARNEGIKVADGKYIAPLDADDLMMPERLENSVKTMEIMNADLLYGAWIFIDKDGNEKGNVQLPLKFEDHIETMNPICQATTMIKKESLGEELYPTFHRYAMDYALWWRLWNEKKKIISIPILLAKYRTHSKSISQSKNNLQNEAKNSVIKYYTEVKNAKFKEMVTVIMPTYSPDKKRDITRAVNSIREQEYVNWELIIINDGGKNPFYMNDMEDCEPRLRFIEAEHKGLSGALNRGLKEAKGHYIAFLDDDDYWSKDHLYSLMLIHNQLKDIGVVYGQTMAVTPEEETIRPYNVMYFDRTKQKEMNLFTICSTITKKECFNTVGIFDESLKTHMDWDMFLRIGQFFKIVPVNKITSFYTQHEEQMSKDEQHLKDRDTVRSRW